MMARVDGLRRQVSCWLVEKNLCHPVYHPDAKNGQIRDYA